MIKKHIVFFLLFLFTMLSPQWVTAKVEQYSVEANNVNQFIEKEVRDPFSYSGLAAFYNGVAAYIVDEKGIKSLTSKVYDLDSNQTLAILGHYKVLFLSGLNVGVSFEEDKLHWHLKNGQSEGFDKSKIEAQLLLKTDLKQLSQSFQRLRYAYLWAPFRALCLGIEKIFLWLNTIHGFGWGVTIILLSLVFKIFILPANILLVRTQRKMSHIQAKLAPQLEKIKQNYSGEEAHHKFMAAHKQQGVTPFYKLKPLFFTLLPVPFLIAIFNVLGEVDMLEGQPFLWIENLAYPDAIYNLGFHIPLLGNTINLLPILMTLLTIFAALLHQNKIVGAKEVRKQRLNLYFMAFGFFVLFYPFPSAMVLYWTFANFWQLIQQRFIHV